MNNIQLLIGVILAVVCACAVGAYIGRKLTHATKGNITLSNIAEGTHEDGITRLTDAAITTRHLLYKLGSDANHIAVCGASNVPLGTVADEAAAAEEYIAVSLLGATSKTRLMVASEALTVGELVFTAASGKISNLSASAGTYYQVGVTVTAAAADGDLVEVATTPAIKVVVP